MKSSAQVERDCEQARRNFAETLEELRTRATPGQLVDEAIDYVRDTRGAEFFRNLQQQVVDNPLPVTLVGAGIAWLMILNARSLRRDEAETGAARVRESIGQQASDAAGAVRCLGPRLAETTGSKARELSERAGSVTTSVADKVRDAAASASDAVSEAKEAAASSLDKIRERTASAYDTATGAIKRASNSSSAIGRNVIDSSQSVLDFCKEQPLVMGGIGLAVGAALGAAIPRSDAEDRLMGEASDEAKEAARRLGTKAAQKAKEAYGEVANAAAQQSDALGEQRSASPGEEAQSSRTASTPVAQSAAAIAASKEAREHADEREGGTCAPDVPSDGGRRH